MEKFCADPVARSVNHPPPSRDRGQLVSRGRWAGLREGENLLQIQPTVAIIRNYGNSYRLFGW